MDWNTYYSLMNNYSNFSNGYNNWNYQVPQFNWANNYPMNFQMPSIFFQGLTPQKTSSSTVEKQKPIQEEKKEEKVIDDGKKYMAISKETGDFYQEQEIYKSSPENIEKYKKEYKSKSRQRSANHSLDKWLKIRDLGI